MTHTENTHSSTIGDNNVTHGINDHSHLELKTFQYTDHNSQDLEYEIDLDNNFFFSIRNNCRYLTTEQFNGSINIDRKLSVIHLNSRSLCTNFNRGKEYLQQFSKSFTVIAISETWFSMDKWVNFELEGYELRYMNRKNKGGGGVALYVDKNLKFRVLDNMSTVVDNVLECVTNLQRKK